MAHIEDIRVLYRSSMSETEGQTTKFYVELEEKCKKRAAREVSELKFEDEVQDDGSLSNGEELTVTPRIPRYLKQENISKIEAHLTEYYMEAVYQKLWEKAQNAVFGAEFV